MCCGRMEQFGLGCWCFFADGYQKKRGPIAGEEYAEIDGRQRVRSSVARKEKEKDVCLYIQPNDDGAGLPKPKAAIFGNSIGYLPAQLVG